MKKIILLILLIALANSLRAQTWSEWFTQKKTQKKYLVEQIAALHVFAKELRDGYRIVSGGLNLVRDIKKDEFNLHKAYFSSLKKVNPKIKDMALAADIVARQLNIDKAFKAFNRQNNLTSEEKDYISSVYKALNKECANDLDDLTELITDGKLGMDDGGRIERLTAIDIDMRDKAAFTQAFLNQQKLLAVQKAKELNGAKVMRQLYDLN